MAPTLKKRLGALMLALCLAGALTALVDVTLAVDESAPCIDPHCSVPGCCAATGSGDAS